MHRDGPHRHAPTGCTRLGSGYGCSLAIRCTMYFRNARICSIIRAAPPLRVLMGGLNVDCVKPHYREKVA
jgi:hypothetical protein